MAQQLLLISQRDEDLKVGDFIALTNGFTLRRASTPDEVTRLLKLHPETAVLWSADSPEEASRFSPALKNSKISPQRVFAITDNPLNQHPHLFQHPVFGHHLYRRFDEQAPQLYSRLVAASLRTEPISLGFFFPKGTASLKLIVTRSSQKQAAVEAINNFFTKKKLTSRLSALAAQATDELLMNAIFDAPVDAAGKHVRRQLDRAADFELDERERVELQTMSTLDYIGLSVTDQYGSLKKDVVLGFLRKDYHTEEYAVRKVDPGAGLGIHGTLTAGLSLLFVSKPGERTEVMLFFPRAKSYKKFREGFRFLSLFSE